MMVQSQLTQLKTSFAALGMRKLVLLGLVGVLCVASIMAAALYFARPTMEPLYVDLNQQDAGRISTALADAGIPFDVNDQRTTVLVPVSDKARARVLLAKIGLPAHATAGYELFDQLGSLGLTSFMQEVTRLRALEGEIARTIQALDGVEAVRVHLVLPEPGSFRRASREPSASVVVRTSGNWQQETTIAIRNIVSAAVAGMKMEHVSVASSSGRVLASGGDPSGMATQKLTGLEGEIGRDLESRAGRTLAPILGVGNYEVSLSVKLDIDRQRIAETTFDPESRVERSVRVIRQSNVSENSAGQPTVGVEANVPEEAVDSTPTDSSRRKDDKREETTNYEINSRRVETERQGYRIERLAVAVVVNRERLVQSLGESPTDDQVEARLSELRRLVAAATGLNEERGDTIELTAIQFDPSRAMPPLEEPGLLNYLAMNLGTFIASFAMVLVTFLVVWFGVRPAVRALAEPERAQPQLAQDATQLSGGAQPDLAQPNAEAAQALAMDNETVAANTEPEPADIDPREKLQELVQANEDGVATVLKKWLAEPERA